jgi:peptide/nickel transport system ATP-binding protein
LGLGFGYGVGRFADAFQYGRTRYTNDTRSNIFRNAGHYRNIRENPKVPNNEEILSIRNLTVDFETEAGSNRVLSDFGYSLKRGATLAIVGESGCGKTVSSLAILGLLPTPPAKIVSGAIDYDSKDLLSLNNEEMRKIRGNRISLIFQNPMTSLNPVLTIGEQITEAMRAHSDISKTEAKANAIRILRQVGIRNAENKINAYPHEFSGGMRQRVMIAMALSLNPEILIADEPTTALDVTIQAQILKLLKDIQRDTGISIILITHNMGIVADIADEIAVVYSGKVIEKAPTRFLFKSPCHPYTKGLIDSIPSIREKTDRLFSIPGNLPARTSESLGCSFADRCSLKMEKCERSEPPLVKNGKNGLCACWARQNENE